MNPQSDREHPIPEDAFATAPVPKHEQIQQAKRE